MRSYLRLWLAVAALWTTLPTPAQAARFSAFGGDALPQGSSLLHAQFGWPGISAAFLYGATPKASLGGRFSFNYGLEGQVTGGVNLGLKFQGLVRLGLVDTGRVSLGLEVAPGLALYFPSFGFTTLGLTLPATFVLGLPLSDALALHAAIEMPLLATLTGYSTFYIPIYFGGGLEYALDKNLQLTLLLRMGPFIDARLSRADFGVEALFGLAFKL